MKNGNTQTAQAAFGLGKKPRSNRRKPMMIAILGGVPLLSLKALILLSSCLSFVLVALVKTVGPMLARATAFLFVFGIATVAMVHYGTKATRWGLKEVAVMTDKTYQKVGETRSVIASLIPRFGVEDDAPRALLVSATSKPEQDFPHYPTADEVVGEEESSSSDLVEIIKEKATEVIGLLPKVRSTENLGFPDPADLPAIEGVVLKKAGGEKIQKVITGILEGMHQTEASGQLEIIGDNGLAFGPFQVRHEPCEDLEKIFGIKINPKDCNGDWALSEYVVRLYTGYWANELAKKTKKPIRGEDILRIWNGGPDRGPMSKTDLYVAKAVSYDPSIATLVAEK